MGNYWFLRSMAGIITALRPAVNRGAAGFTAKAATRQDQTPGHL
jgi:hypothetical protein